MIVVTGTKRSGTSLWMQILAGAGFPVIGEAFPAEWGDSIRDANPRGFYESRLRQGIFYATNPDPRTGAFVHPKDSRRHVVKVFIPGLCRTDYAYLDRVVGTLRSWRDYGPSLARLYALEDEHLARKGEAALAHARAHRGAAPPWAEWFLENYELIRDFSVRRFPLRVHSHERLLEDPERIVDGVLAWIGAGDRAGALAAIEPRLGRTRQTPTPDDVDPAHAEVFDALYDTLHREQPLPGALTKRLDALHKELIAAFGPLSRDRGRDDTP